MRFLCDEMLAGLARWLRAAGFDAEQAEQAIPDRQLVARAQAEHRTLLTRDSDLLQIKGAADVAHLLTTQNLTGWAEELRTDLKLNWLHAPMSRCLVCNVPLEPADAQAIAAMPADARALPGPYNTCPKCHRSYWPGSHVRRMMARLQAFASGQGDAKGPSSAP